MDLHLIECPQCSGNDYKCVWCNGLGRLIIDSKRIAYDMEIVKTKLDWYLDYPEEHFNSKVNFFMDYDENDKVLLEAEYRIKHEVLDDILNSYKAIEKLFKTHNNLDFDYIEYLTKKGYKYEQTAHTLCELCTKKRCKNCNNNPKNIFFEDNIMGFEPVTLHIETWYDKMGYRLESY